MTPRNNHSYIILLAIVVVAGLLVAMLARLAILAKGADADCKSGILDCAWDMCDILSGSDGNIFRCDRYFFASRLSEEDDESADVRVISKLVL